MKEVEWLIELHNIGEEEGGGGREARRKEKKLRRGKKKERKKDEMRMSTKVASRAAFASSGSVINLNYRIRFPNSRESS